MKFRIIKSVGSCCTLLVQNALETGLPDVMLKMLMDVILLDTTTSGKKTLEDESMMMLIECRCTLPLGYRAQRFTTLMVLRSNTSNMTTKEMFVKDLKFATETDNRIAISAVPISFDEWWTRDCDILEHLKKWTVETKSVASILLTSYTDKESGKNRKEIAIYSTDSIVNESIFKVLNTAELALCLMPMIIPDNVKRDHAIIVFEQLNIVASRKQVLPAIEKGMGAIPSSH